MSTTTTERPLATPNLPTKSQVAASTKRLNDCKTLQEAFDTEEFRRLIGEARPKHMDPAAMIRAFVQAANKSPLIYKCDFRQAVGSMMALSYLGLVPGTQLQLAHLIPFARNKFDRAKKEWVIDGYDCNIVIGYAGYIELAFRSGFVQDIGTGLIFPGDKYEFVQGSRDRRIFSHEPNIDQGTTGLTPRAAYCTATYSSGGEHTEVMPWPDILAIRNRSQSYRTAVNARAAAEDRAQKQGRQFREPRTYLEAAWVRDAHEMGRKSVLRRAQKVWPKSPEVHAAAAIEEAQEGGARFDFGPIIEGTVSPLEEGIPEQTRTADDDRFADAPLDDEGGDDGSAGSTFTDRRQQTQAGTQQTGGTGENQATRTEQPSGSSTVTQTPSDDYEAYLVNEFGEPEDQPFTDVIVFSNAAKNDFKRLTDDKLRASWLEFNQDEIERAAELSDEARQIVGQLLAVLRGEPPAQEQKQPEQFVIEGLQPPTMRGGKPDWPGYVGLVKDKIAAIPGEHLLTWIGAQRAVIETAPPAQRMGCIQAISRALASAKLDRPPWFAEAVKPGQQRRPAEQQRGQLPLDQGQAEAERSPEEIWVAKTLDELAAIRGKERSPATFKEFYSFVGTPDFTNTMEQIKEAFPTLYSRVATACNDVQAWIRGPTDEPPPAEEE